MGFAEYIVYLFNFGLAMAAVFALIKMISAGIKLVRSGGEPAKISEAKKQIINCFIGLAVLLTSYILLTTINPDIMKIDDISLTGSQPSTTATTVTEDGEVIKNYKFEEIPIGTITEGILAGNSSERNALPCYEYEAQKVYDDKGRVIIGDTVDQNKDGAINDKDVLLNKDIFYCMSILNEAVKNKTEVHLRILINELDNLLQANCACTNCYYNHLNNPQEPYDCAVSNSAPCIPYEGRDCSSYNTKPSKCESCYYFCGCCGNYETGCKGAGGDEQTQKNYSSCRNTDVINCKRQEIKQLVDGSTPKQECYEKGLIKGMDSGDELKETRLTFQKSIQRLAYFKQYYIDEVDELKKAELKMKEPYGERISMAELYNNVETRKNTSVTINNFDGYDISRYCRKPNCIEYDGETCVKYGFNTKNRICDMDDKAEVTEACKKSEGDAEDEACKEYYTYSGDGATFYFSDEYNNDVADEIKAMDSVDGTCDIEEQSSEKEMYGGLIPIGEVVDYTEDWGTEVSRLIGTLISEIQGIGNTAVIISDFPTLCQCGNCTQSIPIGCCSCPCSGEGCCPSKRCQSNECSVCEPTQIYRSADGSTITQKYDTGCKTCGKRPTTIYSYKAQARPSYYVCPFLTMCSYVRMIYQLGPISNSCFLPSATEEEENKKETQRKQIGYLTRFEVREKMLYSLAGMDINTGTYSAGAASLFPELDCLRGYDEVKVTETINCDSTAQKSIPNRFALINKLETSREKLTGCVNGYSYPNKETANNVRVMSCYEGNKSNVVILPEFPYPDASNAKDANGNPTPYINCYPYNSSDLDVEKKKICFYNIDRTGTEGNPGCLTITKEYMDNYYCCQ